MTIKFEEETNRLSKQLRDYVWVVQAKSNYLFCDRVDVVGFIEDILHWVTGKNVLSEEDCVFLNFG